MPLPSSSFRAASIRSASSFPLIACGVGGSAPCADIDHIGALLDHRYGSRMDLLNGNIGIQVERLAAAVDDPHQRGEGRPRQSSSLLTLQDSHAPSSCRAKVFSMSVAIVMGPTPPGTGVIADAISLTASKSTSPTSFPFQLVDADIDDDRAGFHHLRVIKWAFPTRRDKDICPFEFCGEIPVLLWQTVTVASAFVRSAAIGRPTSMLRPGNNCPVPVTGIVYSASRVMIPLGVQGANRGFPLIKRPRLVGWNPSTSFSTLTAEITLSVSICFGRGSWTRMPLISGSCSTVQWSRALSAWWRPRGFRFRSTQSPPAHRPGASCARTSARPGHCPRSRWQAGATALTRRSLP